MQNSRVEMAFAASDTLSELVWSPHTGLSLKCAVSSSANNKPFLLWNVRPSINELSTPQSIGSKGSEDDKVVDDEKFILSQKQLLGDGKFGNKATLTRNNDKMEDEAGPIDAIQIEEICGTIERRICAVHIMSKLLILLKVAKNIQVRQDILADRSDDSKLIRRVCCNQNRRVEINASRSNSTGLAAPIRSEPRAENFSEALICSPPNLQSRQESDDEVTSASGKVNKNKTRIILYGRSSNDKDSQESAESCNSSKLFTKGLKRQRNDQAQIVGSKRMKRQIQESHVSTSVVRPDSSFMNWISNMAKGLSDCSKVESSSLVRSDNVCGNNHKDNFICNKTLDCESPNMGFHTIFQSLFCQNTKKSDSRPPKDSYAIEESKEATVADEKLSEKRNDDNSGKQIVPSNKEVNRQISRKIVGQPSEPWIFSAEFACTPYVCEMSLAENKNTVIPCDSSRKSSDVSLATSCMPEKSNPPLASLWITRLYNAGLEKCKITEEARECSVFAKRLDALRHIMNTSEKRKSSTCMVIICFFCGTSGHDLRECPELTETELEDFLVKISSFERLEESPCLCITCFQFGHWAISCPLVSSRKRLSTSNGFQKSSASNSEYYLDDEPKFLPCNFVINAQNAVAQEEMFRAIRKLRLSRADVLRWMNSNVSFSHLNGFFLRLRLRKLEDGLEGTAYYVGRITDVEGIKSSVGSQYVSNHDFLEDEIKGWWSRIVKTGGKIPSLDELNSKLKYRTCLCF
ncbi:hypothetical protein DH2020_004761 [Rehmannia glutinosa]|uniref:CCHC-type domain-containing protein n=1 Tax=Rehmannia glutinosa TaxID=99300 RepID=A0ABR0XQA8_REHGL